MESRLFEDHLGFTIDVMKMIGGRGTGASRVMQITAGVFILSDDRGRKQVKVFSHPCICFISLGG